MLKYQVSMTREETTITLYNNKQFFQIVLYRLLYQEHNCQDTFKYADNNIKKTFHTLTELTQFLQQQHNISSKEVYNTFLQILATLENCGNVMASEVSLLAEKLEQKH